MQRRGSQPSSNTKYPQLDKKKVTSKKLFKKIEKKNNMQSKVSKKPRTVEPSLELELNDIEDMKKLDMKALERHEVPLQEEMTLTDRLAKEDEVITMGGK